MTREVVTLGPDASALEAWEICYAMNVRHLPICEGGRLVGLVSDRDLRDASPPRGTNYDEHELRRTRMWEVMSTDPIIAHPLDTIERVAREICEHRTDCVPVVDDGELVGIVTSSDLARAFVELFGADGIGSWVEVEVPNRPGALAGVTDVLGERQVNIASIFLAPMRRATYRAHAASHRTALMRLETSRPHGTVEALKSIGYRASAVESFVPLEPTFEES